MLNMTSITVLHHNPWDFWAPNSSMTWVTHIPNILCPRLMKPSAQTKTPQGPTLAHRQGREQYALRTSVAGHVELGEQGAFGERRLLGANLFGWTDGWCSNIGMIHDDPFSGEGPSDYWSRDACERPPRPGPMSWRSSLRHVLGGLCVARVIRLLGARRSRAS